MYKRVTEKSERPANQKSDCRKKRQRKRTNESCKDREAVKISRIEQSSLLYKQVDYETWHLHQDYKPWPSSGTNGTIRQLARKHVYACKCGDLSLHPALVLGAASGGISDKRYCICFNSFRLPALTGNHHAST